MILHSMVFSLLYSNLLSTYPWFNLKTVSCSYFENMLKNFRPFLTIEDDWRSKKVTTIYQSRANTSLWCCSLDQQGCNLSQVTQYLIKQCNYSGTVPKFYKIPKTTTDISKKYIIQKPIKLGYKPKIYVLKNESIGSETLLSQMDDFSGIKSTMRCERNQRSFRLHLHFAVLQYYSYSSIFVLAYWVNTFHTEFMSVSIVRQFGGKSST